MPKFLKFWYILLKKEKSRFLNFFKIYHFFICGPCLYLSWWSYSERRFETHHRQHQDESVGDCTDTTDRSLVLSQEAITGVYNATMTIQSISKGWLCQHPVLGTHKCATCFQSYEFLPPSFQTCKVKKKSILIKKITMKI